MIVDLGSGDAPIVGAIAYDRRRLPSTHVVGDLRSLPFLDDSIDQLVSQHTIEHLTRSDAVGALKEWYRVLKPGGRLIIATPDITACAATVIRSSMSGDWDGLETITKNLFGGQSYDGSSNLPCGDWLLNTHFWCWSPPTLSEALRDIGFQVRQHPTKDLHELRVLAIKVSK